MKTIISNTAIYQVVEQENGQLTITREYKKSHGEWVKDGSAIQNAGSFIIQQGGIEGVLAKCTDMDNIEEYVATYNDMQKIKHEEAAVRAEEEARKVVEDYKATFSGENTEATADNIRTLLRYLNTRNWGAWSLPKMSIGYACHQYDCDGHTATTIKLDTPIDYNGEKVSMFVYGGTFGHLTKYTRI